MDAALSLGLGVGVARLHDKTVRARDRPVFVELLGYKIQEVPSRDGRIVPVMNAIADEICGYYVSIAPIVMVNAMFDLPIDDHLHLDLVVQLAVHVELAPIWLLHSDLHCGSSLERW